MRISDITIYHFRLPLEQPIIVSQTRLTRREGFLIALKDEKDRIGYGEIAPLPGLNRISLDQCYNELHAIKNHMLHKQIDTSKFHLQAPLFGMIQMPVKWNSVVMFGLECALLNLCNRQNKDGFFHNLMIPDSEKLVCHVNGLYTPELKPEKIASNLEYLKKSGIQSIKVKIGRLKPDEEILQIQRICEYLGDDIILKLDGNRSLLPVEYLKYYDALKVLSVEYVEEPLKKENIHLAREIPWPMALDESLDQHIDLKTADLTYLPEHIKVIILKPGSLMGLHGLFKALNDANQKGIKAVLSSAFNTGITLNLLGLLSHFVPTSRSTAHGLDTLKYFSEDVLMEPPSINRGKLTIPTSFFLNNPTLNHRVLNKAFS